MKVFVVLQYNLAHLLIRYYNLCLHFNCSMQKRCFWKTNWVKVRAKWGIGNAKNVDLVGTKKSKFSHGSIVTECCRGGYRVYRQLWRVSIWWEVSVYTRTKNAINRYPITGTNNTQILPDFQKCLNSMIVLITKWGTKRDTPSLGSITTLYWSTTRMPAWTDHVMYM